MKKTLAIVLALMMLVLALPVGAAGTGGDNDIPFNDLIGKTDPVVKSIAVTTLPTKLTYQIGDALDVTGGKVTLTYDDAHTEEIDLTAEMVTGFDSAAAGKKTLTVTYGEFTATFAVTVEEPVVLSGIEITTLPKVVFGKQEALDVTGGKITLTYSDNTTQEIDMTLDMVTGYSATKVGKQILTVTYEGFTANYEVISNFRIAAAQLALESSMTIMWNVEAVECFENAYMTFDFNGKETTVTEYYPSTTAGRNIFDFAGIAANMMGDDVTATLYGTYNGKEYATASVTYSVLKYAQSKLNGNDANLKTLLVDMLNYGSLAQLYTGRNIDKLVNAGLTDDQKNLASATAPDMTDYQNLTYATIENPEAAWKSAQLVLDSAVVIRVNVLLPEDLTGITLNVSAVGKTWEIPASEFEAYGGANRYDVEFAGLFSTQMNEPVLFTVCRDGTPISNTLQYSIGTYAGKNQGAVGNGKKPYLGDLLIAMMKYGKSAELL